MALGYGLPSKQTVNAVEGRVQARSVRVGCRLWTLDGERTVPTTVAAVRAREVVDAGQRTHGPSALVSQARHAVVAAPGWSSSSSSGSLQTRSMKTAAAMTPMPATTERPA